MTTNSNNKETVNNNIPLIWNGYCPECWSKGKSVRMKLNTNDFFECEETGLQICVLRGIQAIILNFRGAGNFRSTETYADEIENSEILSAQTMSKAPFNNGEIFGSSEEISNFIASVG